MSKPMPLLVRPLLVRLFALIIAVTSGGAILTLLPAPAEAARIYYTYTNVTTTPDRASVYLMEGPTATGQLIGLTPLTKFRMPRGALKLKFVKEGFEDLITTVQIGRTRQSFVYQMKPVVKAGKLNLAAAPGSEGAQVYVNGQHEPEWVLPAIIEVAPGRYRVEVKKAGFSTWDRWVDVAANSVSNWEVGLSASAAAKGTLTVSSHPTGAEIFIGGQSRGVTPQHFNAMEPNGQVVVELRMDGFKSFRETVAITSELQANVHGVLEGDGPAPLDPNSLKASVRIVANVGGATVASAGIPEQSLPTVLSGLDPGTYFFTVKAPGYSPRTEKRELVAGVNAELVFELFMSGQVSVKIAYGVEGDVFVDGKPVGHAPWSGGLAVGAHEATVRTKDGREKKRAFSVGPDRTVELTYDFGNPRAVAAEPVAPPSAPMPWSARAVDPGVGFFDAALGWPFPITLRGGGGIADGFDIAVEFRSAFDVINEFEGVLQWTFIQNKLLAASVEGGIGGGIGGDQRNSFFIRANLKGSALIADRAALTARIGALVYTDRTGPEEIQGHEDRDGGAIITVGVSLEFMIKRGMNLFLFFDGAPIDKQRRMFSESFFNQDLRIYFGVGTSFIF